MADRNGGGSKAGGLLSGALSAVTQRLANLVPAADLDERDTDYIRPRRRLRGVPWPSWESDQVNFGGRTGFIRLALRLGVPIQPVVLIGSQETALFLTRGERLAKLTGRCA